jgi:hypothetical protein
MPILLSDERIAQLISEPKVLSVVLLSGLRWKTKLRHKEAEVALRGGYGSDFLVRLRQSMVNPFDFTAMLVYLPPDTNREFKLLRYNGRSHEHGNRLEGDVFYDFHIHRATARYQDIGRSEESYAVVTNEYATVMEALNCLLRDANFSVEEGAQPSLFGGVFDGN